MRRLAIILHLTWLTLAVSLSLGFGTPRHFDGPFKLVSLFFDTGGLYVLSVLAPALIYYLILIGAETVPDHALKRRLLAQMLIASSAAITISTIVFWRGDAVVALAQPSVFFWTITAASFIASAALPVVRSDRRTLAVAIAASLTLAGIVATRL